MLKEMFCNLAVYAILARMENNALIIGKSLPDIAEFADAMTLAGFKLSVTGLPEEKEALTSQETAVITWNKSSAISARSAVIQAETAHGYTSNTVFYFDSAYFSRAYPSFTTDSCPKILDELTAGFQYLALEAYNRIEQHKKNSRLIFILKNSPSQKDILALPALKDEFPSPLSPLVAAAEASFTAFAENIAALAVQTEFVQPLLIVVERQNETMSQDSALAAWLSEYLTALDSFKSKQNARALCTWIKAGARMPGSFSLFR